MRVNIWDLSGHPEFFEVRNEFYKEGDALVLFYDVTSRRSFESLDMWLREANKFGGEALAVFVVANKVS